MPPVCILYTAIVILYTIYYIAIITVASWHVISYENTIKCHRWWRWLSCSSKKADIQGGERRSREYSVDFLLNVKNYIDGDGQDIWEDIWGVWCKWSSGDVSVSNDMIMTLVTMIMTLVTMMMTLVMTLVTAYLLFCLFLCKSQFTDHCLLYVLKFSQPLSISHFLEIFWRYISHLWALQAC